MATMTINFDKKIGAIKRVNGVGQPPIWGNAHDDMMHFLTEANIPYSRLHDVGGAFGGGCFVDIPNVFPNFDADENDPASYEFAHTDLLLAGLDRANVEPIYRLGVTIENSVGYYASPRIYPPKDFNKWARICEHIVRHYTEGWNNGYHFNITYWEIWNEPENSKTRRINQMWQGTAEDYYRLYEITACHLKKCFPNIKIGGYASSGLYAVTTENPTVDHQYMIDFFHGFLKWITSEEHKAPLDFFSWHSYDPIDNTMIHADYCRRVLDQYGFTNTETHLNEWNPSPRVFGLMKHAAYVGAMICAMQNGPVDVGCFYDARVGISEYGSLFNPITRQPYADYDAFIMFGRLLALGTQVELDCDQTDVYAVAATNGAQHGVMVVNTAERGCRLDLKALNCDLDKAVCEETSSHRRMEKRALIKDGMLEIGAETMVYITL